MAIYNVLAAGVGLVGALLAIVMWALYIVGYWKVFTKAGEAGWKSIIPIYNNYVMFKIAWTGSMFWVYLLLAVVGGWMASAGGVLGAIGALFGLASVLIMVLFCYKSARAFGYGLLFTVGLILFNPIFTIVMGFDSSRYLGPQR